MDKLCRLKKEAAARESTCSSGYLLAMSRKRRLSASNLREDCQHHHHLCHHHNPVTITTIDTGALSSQLVPLPLQKRFISDGHFFVTERLILRLPLLQYGRHRIHRSPDVIVRRQRLRHCQN
jgi:hypothetical protein